MRQIAHVNRPGDKIKRVMICEDRKSFMLFFFDTMEDQGCCADAYHESMKSAKKVCARLFGIGKKDWETVPDPEEGHRHDLIAPTPIK